MNRDSRESYVTPINANSPTATASAYHRLNRKDTRWMFLGLGNVTRSKHLDHRDLMIDQLFAEIKNDIVPIGLQRSNFTTSSSEEVRVSVNEIPRFKIGDILHHGKLIASTQSEVYQFPRIDLGENCRMARVGSREQRTRLHALPVDFYHECYKIARSTVYIVNNAVSSKGYNPTLFFPWNTIFKFFYVNSQNLSSAIFRGEIEPENKIWNESESYWENEAEGKYILRLKKEMKNSDAWIVAHMAAHENYKKQAIKLITSMHGDFWDNAHPNPICDFPIEKLHDIKLNCVSLGDHNGTPSLLVTEILSCDVAAALSPRINIVNYKRENPGDQTGLNDKAIPRTINHYEKDIHNSNDEFHPDPQLAGDTDRQKEEIEENNYASPFSLYNRHKTREGIYQPRQTTNKHIFNKSPEPAGTGSTLDSGGHPGADQRLNISSPSIIRKHVSGNLDATIHALSRLVDGGEITTNWIPSGDPKLGYDLKAFIPAFNKLSAECKLWVATKRKYKTRICSICECTVIANHAQYYVLEFELRPTEDRCVFVVKTENLINNEEFITRILTEIINSKAVSKEFIDHPYIIAIKHVRLRIKDSGGFNESDTIHFSNRFRRAMGIPLEKNPEIARP